MLELVRKCSDDLMLEEDQGRFLMVYYLVSLVTYLYIFLKFPFCILSLF